GGCRTVQIAKELTDTFDGALRALLVRLRAGNRFRLHAGYTIAYGGCRGRHHAAESVVDRIAGRPAATGNRDGNRAGLRIEPDGLLRRASGARRVRDRVRLASCFLPGRGARFAGCVGDGLDDPRTGPARRALGYCPGDER